MKKKLFIGLFVGVVIVVAIIYNGAVAYVDNQLANKNHADVYDSCHKVWAARGLYNQRSEQNTPEAMSRAFSLGANGAEVDVHFDLKIKRFIVSHDHPVKGDDGELIYSKKNGSLLFLEDFFKAVGKDRFFWLDFKNLGQLNDQQTAMVIHHLEKITKFDSIKDRLYIEGSNPLLLSKYTDAGFKTILGIHPIRESLFASSFVINVFKMGYYFNNITVLAMPYGKLDDPTFGSDTIKSLSAIPTFVFHVPDNEKLVRDLVSTKNVRVVLVGKDLSINRYGINTCL